MSVRSGRLVSVVWGVLVGCAGPTTAGSTDASQALADTAVGPPAPVVTERWTEDFPKGMLLSGWAMGDCDGDDIPTWTVYSSGLSCTSLCKHDLFATPGIELGTSLTPPEKSFNQGWLVMQLVVEDIGAYGFQYGGDPFGYYRVSLHLDAGRARFAQIALPPFDLDGKLTPGHTASEPSLDVFGERLDFYAPIMTSFELALMWSGDRHELYVDGELVLAADAPSRPASGPLPGGPFSLYAYNVSVTIDRLETYPPGPAPWERADRASR